HIIESGTVEWGLLGIRGIEALTPNDAPLYGLDENAKGVIFPEVIEDSAAEKAGLTHNDVILEVNGVPVETGDALVSRIATLKPGTKVELTIWRNYEKQKLTVELGSRPTINQVAEASPNETLDILGFTVENLTRELAVLYGYENRSGVVITQVGPNLSGDIDALAIGTLIVDVDRQQVSNVQEFERAIEAALGRGQRSVRLRVENNGTYSYVSIILSRR
ncbi:PDZ domain-containing protein, partial [Planctomycetota bacterium]